MRASRLLQMLLLLQNRGRMTCAALARELEVNRRTILRDVDALTEAGLPVIVIRGNQGGVELAFNYRTRLTGLASDEAEALAIILSQPSPFLDELQMRGAGQRALAKLIESFPEHVRTTMEKTRQRFRFGSAADAEPDERIAALATAIRSRLIVTIGMSTGTPRTIHPQALVFDKGEWSIVDALKSGELIPLSACGAINISAKQFAW